MNLLFSSDIPVFAPLDILTMLSFDRNGFAASRSDFLNGLLAELVRSNLEGLTGITIAKNLHWKIPANQTG